MSASCWPEDYLALRFRDTCESGVNDEFFGFVCRDHGFFKLSHARAPFLLRPTEIAFLLRVACPGKGGVNDKGFPFVRGYLGLFEVLHYCVSLWRLAIRRFQMMGL